MNPVRLIFKHGGEMLVSPIGLRFVEDPDHGPLVLIPELSGPRAYQLDMTLEEAERGYRDAASMQPLTNSVAVKLEEVEKKLELLGRRQEAIDKKACSEIVSLHKDLSFVGDLNVDRWKALKIHLGLPEGWEHLHEGAAEVKGALVSQAELIDKLEYSVVNCARWCGSLEQRLAAVEKELSLLKEEASLFTLAERVGELEESRRAAFQRLCDAELRLHSLEDRHRQMTNEAEGFRRDVENDRVCVQRQSIHPHLPSHWSTEAKSKSAWKPLSSLEGQVISGELRNLFVRQNTKNDRGYPRAVTWSPSIGCWIFQDTCMRLVLPFGEYEFCPIPE